MATFETNERHREIFGDLVGGRWTAGEWLRKDSRWIESKDLTVFAGGMEGQVASKRFDLLLMDDVLGRSNTATIGQIEKVKNWYDNPLSKRVVAQGVTIVFGTRWADGDLYQTFMTPVDEGGYGFDTIIARGYITDDGPDEEWVDERGKPQRRLNGFRSYWEERWPVEYLAKERAKNPAQFDLSINNDIEGLISGDIFQRRWYQGHYYGTRGGDPLAELPGHVSDYIIRMGQDFASSEKERADWTARVTSAEHKDTGNFYVMRTHREKIGTGHTDFVLMGYLEYPEAISAVICEDNAFQSTIVKQIAKEYPQVPVFGRKTDTDKVTRAMALGEKYKMGKVHHHLSLESGELEREQLGFKRSGGMHDDLIDAEGFSMDLATGSTFFFGKLRAR
jgi:phage terminase large subunit-like protein